MSLNFLRRNPGLKIFSLFLAVFLWAYVKYTSTPYATLSSEARIKVPVTIEGLGENLVIIDVPDEVTLTVQGAPEKLASLKTSNFKAYLDVTNKKPGNHNLTVRIDVPSDLRKVNVIPETVSIRIDPLQKRVFAVKVKSQGTLAPGFILKKMASQPESVTVTGAQSLIARVKEIRAISDIEGVDMDIVQRVAVEIVDENEKIINGLSAEPGFVRASIAIRTEVMSATVPIVPDISGNPAKGYVLNKIAITPPSATVRYRYNLESPPKLIKTKVLSIEGANGSIARDIGITVPKDISLIEPESVKVHIIIEPVDSITPQKEKVKREENYS